MSTTAADTTAEASPKPSRNWRRLLRKAALRLLLLPVLVVAFLLLLLYLPPVQQFIRGQAVSFLSEKTGTKVTLDRLRIFFPLDVRLEGLFVADQQGDTLLHAEHLRANAGLRALLGGRLLLKDVALSGVRANLSQDADSTFNFDFIIAAFASMDPKADADSSGTFSIDARNVHLERVLFTMDMQPSELAMRVDLGELDVTLDGMALDPLQFHLHTIDLHHTTVDLRSTSSTPEAPSYPALTNPLADIDVRFKRITTNDVHFSMATVDTGDSLWISLKNGTVEAREVDALTQRWHMADVDLDGFQLGTLSMSNTAQATTDVSEPLWLDQRDGFRYWTQDWDLAIDRLIVSNSGIAFHSGSISTPALLLDPAHLVYNGIAVDARHAIVENERLHMAIDRMVAQGGPDHENVEAAVVIDARPDAIFLQKGRLTAKENTVAFAFSAWPKELADAYQRPHAIPMEAEASAELRMADLVPLLQQLGVDLPAAAVSSERWATKLQLKGSIENIEYASIDLDGDEGSAIHANGRVQNAAQWPNSSYAIAVDDLKMGAGLRQVVQAYAPPDVPLPTRLEFNGDGQGQGYDLTAHVDLKSDLGDLVGTAESRNWKGALPDHFALDLKADHIATARFSGDTALGPMSFKLVAEADGLHGNSRQGSLLLTPSVLTYNGNDLSSLRLEAYAIHDSVRMDLSSNADAVELQLHGAGPWPTMGDSIIAQIDLNVVRVHLQDLGFTPHMLNADGQLKGRIAILPNLLGRVTLEAPGLHLFNPEQDFVFERFALSGLLDNDSTAVELDCDVALISYHANLAMDSTMSLIRDRLWGAFQEPYAFVPPPNRRIDLEVDLPGDERLNSLVLPELRAMEVKHFAGRYDSDGDSLTLLVDVPLVDYAGVEVKGLLLDLRAVGPELEGDLAVQRIMRDSLHLDDMLLQATNAPGALRTLFRMRNGLMDRYRIGIDLSRDGDIPVVHVQEDLVLDRVAWHAATGNALYLDPKGLRAEDMVLRSGEQQIELRMANDGNHLDIRSFDLGNIFGLVRDADSLAVIHGTMDATVLIPMTETERLKADVSFHDLEVMDVGFRTVELQVDEDRKDHYQGTLQLAATNNTANATLDADMGGEDARITVDSDLDLHDLAQFKPFAEEYLFDLGGALKGKLRYEQDGDKLAILGDAALTDCRVGLVKTGAVYRIEQDTVTFDHQGIDLNKLTVLDGKDNRFELDGRVNTGTEQEPGLDLRLRTERFQLVNSTAKDNPMFYGKLYGGIDLQIGGTANTPTVKGEVSVLDSTAISVVLPGSQVEMIDHDGIVQFTADFAAQDTLAQRTDSEMLRDSLAAQLPGIDLDLRLKLDPNARFSIVIDPTTGDAAQFRGEADLLFRYDPAGDIYLQGPFTVKEGGYTLEFYGLVKKRFELVPGGTIIWDGDPLAGRMDVQAKYSTEVAPYPLVANSRGGLSESERNSLQAPLPFDVLINFQESVQSPKISFGLDMDRLVRNSYPQVNSALDQLSKPASEEELNRQVFGLLVLSTFIENESGTEPAGSSLASTAARNSVNSILTQQLNRLTGKGIKGMDIQLGVNTYDQTQGGESYSRTTVDYKVTQQILNDRVSLEAGGSMGYSENKQDVSAMSNTKAPQYAIAYDITTDGRIRLRLYHENAYDLYDGELVNNGVALMLTRDFEKNAKERDGKRDEILKQRRTDKGTTEP